MGIGKAHGPVILPRRDMMTLPVKTYRKRETIYRTGDSGGYLPKVLSGAVMLYTICDDGHRQIVDLAGTGDFLHFDVDGEIEHFAEALTESQIGFFPASALMGDPETAEYLVDQMRARIAIERRHITMMAKKSAHQRLADFLGLAAHCPFRREKQVFRQLLGQG